MNPRIRVDVWRAARSCQAWKGSRWPAMATYAEWPPVGRTAFTSRPRCRQDARSRCPMGTRSWRSRRRNDWRSPSRRRSGLAGGPKHLRLAGIGNSVWRTSSNNPRLPRHDKKYDKTATTIQA